MHFHGKFSRIQLDQVLSQHVLWNEQVPSSRLGIFFGREIRLDHDSGARARRYAIKKYLRESRVHVLRSISLAYFNQRCDIKCSVALATRSLQVRKRSAGSVFATYSQ
jgi:hypothetical protein